MKDWKFRRIEKQDRTRLFYLFSFLLIIFMLASCKTTEYKDGYKKGFKDGERKGYGQGYEKAKKEWYQLGIREGNGIEYQRGKKDGYREGSRKGYDLGFKAGKRQGRWEGAKAFIKKWWKPSLGIVILLLTSIFVFFTLFLLVKNFIKRLAEKVVKTVDNFRLTIHMERLLRMESKKQK
jgi:flagellar biosynthesis/type III secretory pathway protein FliH